MTLHHADALVATFAACGVSPRRVKARGEPTGLPAWKTSFGERLATRDELQQTEARLRAEIREAKQRAMNRAYLALGGVTAFLTAVIAIATSVIVALD